MSATELDQAVSRTLWGRRIEIPPGGLPTLGEAIRIVLRANPDRFVEVAPGVWARRSDGPDAGARSRQPQRPLAGGAAAAAVPPEPTRDVDAVARPGLAAS